MKTNYLKPTFVDLMPATLQDGIIYISIEYGTVIHNCCCGCGNKVVTPLSPTDWKLIYDGDNISLTPSIGNWSFRCQSHYWIRNGKIDWADKFSINQIEKVRQKDKYIKSKYFSHSEKQESSNENYGNQTVEFKRSFILVILKKLRSIFH